MIKTKTKAKIPLAVIQSLSEFVQGRYEFGDKPILDFCSDIKISTFFWGEMTSNYKGLLPSISDRVKFCQIF